MMMRAYVITGEVVNQPDNLDTTVGVVSSRKAAIKACEDYLFGPYPGGEVEWHEQEKHTGFVTLIPKLPEYIGPVRAWYQMFIINDIK